MYGVSFKAGLNPENSNLNKKNNSASTSQMVRLHSAMSAPASSLQMHDNHKKDTLSLGSNHHSKDALISYPLRLCAYTNEVGAALAPIPVIGPMLFKLSWIPALMYFGADIYDKYAKGEDNDYTNASSSKAVRQTTFQALASVILPTAAVMMGQNIATKFSGVFSKDKMTTGAKEDILEELKRDLNQDKIRKFRDQINKAIKENPSLSIDQIKQTEGIKQLKNVLLEQIFEEIKIESESARRHKAQKGLFSKFASIFIHSHGECENLADVKPENFDSKVKTYLKRNLNDMIDMRIELQNVLNADGTLNEKANHIEPKLLKKLKKLLEKNRNNRDIVDKCSYVVKECLLDKVTKRAMKLSLVKIVGGFTALATLAIPIDRFVEHYVIGKVVDPGLDQVKKKVNELSFASKNSQ